MKMKKITIALSFFFFTNLIFSQVYPVFDTKKSEIYGYLVFEIVEKIDKNESKYIATLLDINLNKVAQTVFIDNKSIKIGNIHYNGKTIYFEVIPGKGNKSSIASEDFTFRIYDLKENKISNKYTLPEINKDIYVRGSYPIENEGYGIIIRNFKTQINEFYAISNSNQQLYKSFPFGNESKKKETEHIIVGDIRDDLMVTINRKYPNKKSNDPTTSLLFVDVLTGNTIKEINFDTDDIKVEISNVQITADNIYAFGDTFASKHEFISGKTTGLYKAVVDPKGTLINGKKLAWSDLLSKIDIKEGGFVKNSGYIYTHSYVLDKKTNHTIVVGEYIIGSLTSVSVKDMIFLDFDENFNFNQVFEVEKKQSTLNLGGFKMGGSRQFANTLKDYNYFDYRFYNTLENESGLSFFYFNVEKLFLIGSSSFSHGIVTYKDGNFNANKLQWDTSIWKSEFINLLPSKPGYILLSKITKDKILENRLERIDYE